MIFPSVVRRLILLAAVVSGISLAALAQAPTSHAVTVSGTSSLLDGASFLDVSRLQQDLRAKGHLIAWPGGARGAASSAATCRTAKNVIRSAEDLKARISGQLHITKPDYVRFSGSFLSLVDNGKQTSPDG